MHTFHPHTFGPPSHGDVPGLLLHTCHEIRVTSHSVRCVRETCGLAKSTPTVKRCVAAVTTSAEAHEPERPDSLLRDVTQATPRKRGRREDDEASGGEEADFVGVGMDAVIKVFATHTEPNFSLPWQRKRQVASTSSGFIIAGRRILTNAHSVEHSTQVKVKHRGSDAKYVAKVLAIGAECDLALLTVDDDAFWEGVTPIALGKLPRLQDSVTVVGFPIGGDTISVTAGVVSRIEMTPYAHSSCDLLGVQIDAAINAGNSGGPCFDDKGTCIGVAFQSLKSEDADGIGYIVPVAVVEHFLSGTCGALPLLQVHRTHDSSH